MWATTVLSLGNTAISVWKTRCALPRTKATVENEAEMRFFFFLTFFCTLEIAIDVEFLHHRRYEKASLSLQRVQEAQRPSGASFLIT